jgi:opacity protein-like surface antigen
MPMRKIRSVFVAVVVFGAFLISAPAMAEKSSKKNFNQPGPYVAVGFGAAFDFLEDIIEENFPIADIESGWSANVRGGYRVASWFAVEVMYEGMYGLDVDIAVEDVPGIPGTVRERAELDYHGLYVSPKLIVPLGRFQPYFLFGLGTQYAKWKGSLGILDVGRWDFAIRPALGLDVAATENVAVFVEIGVPIRFATWRDIPSEVTDNVSLTVGAGVQYRF